MYINITSRSNFTGFNKLRFLLRQSPEMLNILSLAAWVAGMAKIFRAKLEIRGNLLIIDEFFQNLITFNFSLNSIELLPKNSTFKSKSLRNVVFRYSK